MLTTRTHDVPNELPGPTIYSNLLAQVQFHLMINDTYNQHVSNADLRVKELLAFDAKITTWVKSLPPHLQQGLSSQQSPPSFKFAPYHLFWRVSVLKIVLFFPVLLHLARGSTRADFQQPDTDQQAAVTVCIGHTHDIVLSIDRFLSQEPSNALRDWYAQ